MSGWLTQPVSAEHPTMIAIARNTRKSKYSCFVLPSGAGISCCFSGNKIADVSVLNYSDPKCVLFRIRTCRSGLAEIV
jgi:hypothetical protein